VSRPADHEARRLAATCFDRNLAVLAGAGTGKTSLLVERLLNAIASGAAMIERLAAITFTQKAAGEMRERLADGLERLIVLARSADARRRLDEKRSADRAWTWLRRVERIEPVEIGRRALGALNGLNRSTVDTIHGFCASVLREHPIEAGVDPGFAVDQGQHFQAVLDETWDAFVAAELGADAPRPTLWRRLREKMALARIESVARGLAAFDVPAELLSGRVAPDAGALFGEQVRERLADIDTLFATEKEITPKSRLRLELMRTALEVFRDRGLEAFVEHIEADAELSDALENNRKPAPSRKAAAVLSEAEFKALAHKPFLLARNLLATDDELMSDLVEALGRFAVAAREALLRRGYVGFDGLLVLTRDLLRDHLDVREAVKRRVGMLLVDEFQDTDPLQYEIVLFLAEQPGGRAEDAFAAELEPGRLFVVGDAKQSIYRFRGADYGAFRRAIRRIEAQRGQAVDLTVNYRSVPGVLEPVNRLFEDGAGVWRESTHQPRYVPIRAARDGDAETRVELWTLAVDGERALRAEQRRSGEGRIIAQEIHRWVEQERRLGYGQVTILLRAFTNLALYLRPLREWGIPFVVDGGREFLKRPEVGHLIAALRALAQPTDEVALLAFARSPAAGVPDTELARWAARDGRWDYRIEPGAELPALDRAFAVLRDLREATRELPADQIVRRVLERTGLLIASAAAFEGAQRVANLRKLAAAAAEMARHGELSLLEVIAALEEERAADVESDSPLADEGVEAVRVLTVHKAKGLENDVVIVADLARRDFENPTWKEFDVRVAALPDGSRTLALQSGRIRNAAGVFVLDDERLHDLAEEDRVLYVALTRARERLVVVGAASPGTPRWLEALKPWGYDKKDPPADGVLIGGDGVLHRRIRPERAPHQEQQVLLTGAPEAVDAHGRAWDRLRETARPPFRRPSGEREDDGDDAARWRRRAEERGSRSRAAARVVGAVVHRALELWDGEPAELITLGARLAGDAAAREQLPADDVQAGVATVLRGFVASPLCERLREADVVGREVPMLQRRGDGATWRGSIDLIYRAPDGGLVVADYKTDDETDEAAMRERYGEQLGIYAEAVRRAQDLARPPRAELWLLRSGTVVEL
jgi:ATP-dependent helicase/nuclease subunit A